MTTPEAALPDRPRRKLDTRGATALQARRMEGDIMLTLRDVMTPDVLTIAPDFTLRELVDLFGERGIDGLPVVSGDRIVGVVSTADLLEFLSWAPWIPEMRPYPFDWDDGMPSEWNDEPGTRRPAAYFVDAWNEVSDELRTRLDEASDPDPDFLNGHAVGEVMSRRLAWLPADTPVHEAVERMLRAGIQRLLVLEADRLVGVVTTADLMGVLEGGRASDDRTLETV